MPCALIGLKLNRWKLERYPIGCIWVHYWVTGAGGQLILFLALREGHAYIVFPVISLYLVVTILLSIYYLKESSTKSIGLGLCLHLLPLFFYPIPNIQNKSLLVMRGLCLQLLFLSCGYSGFCYEIFQWNDESGKHFFLHGSHYHFVYSGCNLDDRFR